MHCYEVAGLSLFSSAAAAVDTCLALTALVVAHVEVVVFASRGLAKVAVKISVVVVHFFSLEAVVGDDGRVTESGPADISSSLTYHRLVLRDHLTEDFSGNDVSNHEGAHGVSSPGDDKIFLDDDFFPHANLGRVGVPWGSIPTNIYIIQ